MIKKFDELELLKIMSGQELYTDMVSFADLNDAVKNWAFKAIHIKSIEKTWINL